jgi:hypothetical protein
MAVGARDVSRRFRQAEKMTDQLGIERASDSLIGIREELESGKRGWQWQLRGLVSGSRVWEQCL